MENTELAEEKTEGPRAVREKEAGAAGLQLWRQLAWR